jgi:hypothetical protein
MPKFKSADMDETPDERERRKSAMTAEEWDADEKRRAELVALSTDYRAKSRAHVRGWWKARMEVIADMEQGKLEETRKFLEKASQHRGPWGPAEKAKAAGLLKKLAAKTEPAPEPPPVVETPAPADDWSAIEKALSARDGAFATLKDRSANLGTN